MALETEIVSVISQVGFPVAIAIYLLITRDQTIQKNTDAIERLHEAVIILCNREQNK